MKTNFEQNILDKIQKDSIVPLPKWMFVVKNTLIWISFIILFVIGCISGGFAITLLHTLLEEIPPNYSLLEQILASIHHIPFPILLIVILVFILLIVLLKNTSSGYKFTGLTLFLVNFILVIITGNLLYVLEGSTMKNMDYTKEMRENFVKETWNQPKLGLLFGEITSLDEANTIIIKDDGGKIWKLKVKENLSSKELKLEIGDRIEIIGVNSEAGFEVKEIRLFGKREKVIQK